MTKELEDICIDLLRKEVVPATGCTEPVAVALAAAKASSILGEEVKKATILLSSNMLKNAMGVGIPGTGMIGLPIAVALGIVIAEPEKELSVLSGFSSDKLEKAKAIVAQKIIQIRHKEGDVDKLYIEVLLEGDSAHAEVIIEGTHTNISYVARNGEVILNKRCVKNEETATLANEEERQLDFDTVYRFATETDVERLSFIEEAVNLNRNAADFSLQGNFGHQVGRMIRSDMGRKYLGQSTFTEILSYTTAACDARMDGAPVSVMSNSGSGNQGITATLPVAVFARQEGKSREETIRALILSNLMVIYIKQKLGRLSALCGCVVAATGSSCGLTYLLGGTREQVAFAVKNMVGNITGMLCDGAKPSCSMKVSSGVSSALFSALLAVQNRVVTSEEGIVDDDVDRTIENLTSIGRNAMSETDRLVLDIMTSKKDRS